MRVFLPPYPSPERAHSARGSKICVRAHGAIILRARLRRPAQLTSMMARAPGRRRIAAGRRLGALLDLKPDYPPSPGARAKPSD